MMLPSPHATRYTDDMDWTQILELVGAVIATVLAFFGGKAIEKRRRP